MALLLIAYLLKYRQKKEKSHVLEQKSFILRCWSVCIVENKEENWLQAVQMHLETLILIKLWLSDMRSTVYEVLVLLYKPRENELFTSCFPGGQSTINMKVLIALLFLAAVVFVRAEEEKEPDMKFHPQAVLHYLEMEDEKMAKHVRSILKMDQKREPKKESMFPTALPTGIPKQFVSSQW